MVFDTIQDTTINTTSFFLRREAVVKKTDSLSFGFSPYKVIPTDSDGLNFRKDSIHYTVEVKPAGKIGIPRNYPQRENSFFFLIFLFCFLLFSIFFRSTGKSLIENFKNQLNLRNRNVFVYKEQVTTTEVWAEAFLILQTLLIASVIGFVFFWDRGISEMSVVNRNIFFVGFVLFFGLFILLRILGYKIFGAVFFPNDVRELNKKYLWVVALLGVLLFLPALFYVFAPEFRTAAAILMIIIFFINRIVIIASVFNIFVKNRIGLLYFIVYLCAVEIVPYFLLYVGPVSMINFGGNIVL